MGDFTFFTEPFAEQKLKVNAKARIQTQFNLT